MTTISEIKEKIYESDREFTAFIAVYNFEKAAAVIRQMEELCRKAAEIQTSEKSAAPESADGKYADKRREVLMEHAPEVYEAMEADGSLEAHLMSVQETVSDYVDMRAEKYRMSDEYRRAEASDPAKALRLLNMTVLEAEEAAYRMWIGNIPENENEEDEENE